MFKISLNTKRSRPPGLPFVSLPAFLFACLVCPLHGSDNEADEWALLLQESEKLLEWSADPLKDLGLEPEPDPFLWSVGIKGGFGYSDNYLKRLLPVSSVYAVLEGDAFVNLDLGNSTFTALLYAEGLAYDRKAEARSESTAFLHTNWTRYGPAFSWGGSLDLFYSDQIYDASLILAGEPVGESFRQVRPQLELFAEWALGEKNLLRLQGSLRRSIFDDQENDYWRPALGASWNRVLLPSLTMTSEVLVYREIHDSTQPRLPTGLPVASPEELEVNGIQLEQEVSWDPSFPEPLSFRGRFGATLENSLGGSYEDAVRWLASVDATWKGEFVDLNLSGLWQNTRYDERQVGFFDERPLHQSYRSLRLEMEKDLPAGLSVLLRGEWSDFSSRDGEEPFEEKRIDAVLNWSY